MKFLVAHKSPTIKSTDLFDVERFGCYEDGGGFQGFNFTQRLAGDYGKRWWRHPSITFGMPLRQVEVHLQDLTTGEDRWRAVYDLEGRTQLDGMAEPLGGRHPFFQPDWCPPPGDFLAHKYRLHVQNLGSGASRQTGSVGDLFFTQYGPALLANSYSYESA